MSCDKYKIALHAPNLLNVCIDKVTDENVSGRIYHCYTEEPMIFCDWIQCIELMDRFFDTINFPQATVQTRNFVETKSGIEVNQKKVREQIEVAEFRGEIASFLVHVTHRQNATWQGEVEWAEIHGKKAFDSELDFMKIVTCALEKH